MLGLLFDGIDGTDGVAWLLGSFQISSVVEVQLTKTEAIMLQCCFKRLLTRHHTESTRAKELISF